MLHIRPVFSAITTNHASKVRCFLAASSWETQEMHFFTESHGKKNWILKKKERDLENLIGVNTCENFKHLWDPDNCDSITNGLLVKPLSILLGLHAPPSKKEKKKKHAEFQRRNCRGRAIEHWTKNPSNSCWKSMKKLRSFRSGFSAEGNNLCFREP